MRIDAAVCSNMGKVRRNNEDNFYFNGVYMNESQRNKGGLFSKVCDDDKQIYAVCDGMGGEEGGEDASITAARGLKQYAEETSHIDSSTRLKNALQNISNTIEANASRKGFRSGTTIAMVVVEEGNLRTVHVGDSRVYGVQDGQFSRMTVDHSEVQRLFSMGLITEAEMSTHPKRHAISQFLGMPHEEVLLSPTVSTRIPLKAGNRYLLCSDGLTDMVPDQEIGQILTRAASAEEAVRRCVSTALQHGGRDNVTCIALFLKPGDAKMKRSSKNKLTLWLSGLAALAGAALIAVSLLQILS